MTAYKNTAVSVSKSQEAIRALLQKRPNVRGVQFTDDFKARTITVRFVTMVKESPRTVTVTMKLPEPTSAQRQRRARRNLTGNDLTGKDSQLERAVYRALLFWLKSQFEAIDFGLFKFEDSFLSFFEWQINGNTTTVGAIVRPNLDRDMRLLQDLSSPQEGEIVDQ